MATINDSFTGPTLDSSRWNSSLVGSVSLGVGIPAAGVYPQGVNDHGDGIAIHSYNKVTIPAGVSFDQRIFYQDVYQDANQRVSYFLGWRSNLQSGGQPVWGVDVMLTVRPGGNFLLEKQYIVSGVTYRKAVKLDPLGGANGGFRVYRLGNTYSLFYYNSGWVFLDDVVLPYSGPGYVQFGVVAEDPSISFPWIFQT